METVMKYCVASIEDGVAVLEAADRTAVSVDACALPENVREGDWLAADGVGGFISDPDETARRRKYNSDLFKSLLES